MTSFACLLIEIRGIAVGTGVELLVDANSGADGARCVGAAILRDDGCEVGAGDFVVAGIDFRSSVDANLGI